MKDKKNIDPRLKKRMIKLTDEKGKSIYVDKENYRHLTVQELRTLGFYGDKLKTFSELTAEEQRLFSSGEDKENTVV